MTDIHALVVKLKALESELGRTPNRQEFLDNTDVTDWQLRKITFQKVLDAAGMVSLRSQPSADRPETKDIPESVTRAPRVLYFDIETAPITGYTWGTYEQSVIKILKDWFVLSYAARFENDDRFFYLDQRFSTPIDDDYQLLCGIHHLLSECDILVGHNSMRFDTRKLNARFIKHGLSPLNHYKQIDTLKIARKHFAFTSNKLADLAVFLGCDIKKSTHAKFPGFSMWDECMKGNKEAFEEMESYNKTDVDVLIAVFKKLAPWEPSINFQAFYRKPVCQCGSEDFHKDGFRFSGQGKFQVFRCRSCSKPFTGKENLIDKDIRKGFFK